MFEEQNLDSCCKRPKKRATSKEMARDNFEVSLVAGNAEAIESTVSQQLLVGGSWCEPLRR